MAVVKANAYGHGAVPLARLYRERGVRSFAVACLDEAVELRIAGIAGEILILGYTPAPLAGELLQYDLTQTVYDPDQARELSERALSLGGRVKSHLKLDTGMGRIGFPCGEDGAACVERVTDILNLPGLLFEGVFTHFSSADGDSPEDREFTRAQFGRFSAAVGKLRERGYRLRAHCCNSAGALLYPEARLDAVRPGIILYGAGVPDPSLRPVMTLKTTVTEVKNVSPGTPVGYGRCFTTSRPTRVATLAIGYADGFPRCLTNTGKVTVGGRDVPVIGRVCMDQIMADVTDVPGVSAGDTAVVFGEGGAGADDFAASAGTISYEIFCRVAPRVKRVYTLGGKRYSADELPFAATGER